VVVRWANIRVLVPARADKGIGEQHTGKVIDNVESHIHTATTNHDPVTLAAPRLKNALNVPVDIPHPIREK
jgi:hypothetical protein